MDTSNTQVYAEQQDGVLLAPVEGTSLLPDLEGSAATGLKSKVDLIVRLLAGTFRPQGDEKILVAGCGNGTEAYLLGSHYGIETIGIDYGLQGELTVIGPHTQVGHGDITDLQFGDGSFDLVYCYHVLEHVKDPGRALAEMKRVMTRTGSLFIGFPNKNRVVGYLGQHEGASLWEVVGWNLNDYRKRLRGEFENRLGAHAGFTEREFLVIAAPYFASIRAIRNEYMLGRYAALRMFIMALVKTGLAEFAFPSNYFVCAG